MGFACDDTQSFMLAGTRLQYIGVLVLTQPLITQLTVHICEVTVAATQSQDTEPSWFVFCRQRQIDMRDPRGNAQMR
jgi:hypothetical protein